MGWGFLRIVDDQSGFSLAWSNDLECCWAMEVCYWFTLLYSTLLTSHWVTVWFKQKFPCWKRTTLAPECNQNGPKCETKYKHMWQFRVSSVWQHLCVSICGFTIYLVRVHINVLCMPQLTSQALVSNSQINYSDESILFNALVQMVHRIRSWVSSLNQIHTIRESFSVHNWLPQ